MARGGSRYAVDVDMKIQSLTESIVDQELAAKLESELAVEKEIRDSEQLPANIKDFLDDSPFEVSLP